VSNNLPQKMSPRASLLLGIGLVLLGLSFVHLKEPADPGPFLILAFCALMMELFCPRIPGFGFASAAFVVYLGCGLHPSFGPSLGITLAAGIGATRFLGRRHPRWSLGMEEAVGDFFPLVVCLTGYSLVLQQEAMSETMARIVSVGIFAPLTLTLSRISTSVLGPSYGSGRRRALERLLPFVLCGSALAIGVLFAPTSLTVLSIIILQLGMAMAVTVAEAQERGLLEIRLRKTEQALAETDEELSVLHQGFQIKNEECKLLEAMSTEIVKAEDFGQAVDRLLQLGRELVPSRSLVFFRPDGTGAPTHFRSLSEETKALQEAELVGLSVPIVERAWQSRSPRVRKRTKADNTPLSTESSAVAIPVGTYGVLYCGRTEKPFTESQLRLLALLTDQARLALHTAEKNQERRKAYETSVQQGQQLKSQVTQLDVFLEASLRLSEAESELDVLQRAGAFLPQLAQAEAGLFVVGSQRLCFGCDEDMLRDGPLKTLSEGVLQGQAPLIVPDFETSSFEPPLLGARSLLGIRLPNPEGVLFLLSRRPSVYSISEQERLKLFSVLLAQAVERVHLHGNILRSAKLTAVGQLAAGMAHEINNPLAAISMGVESAGLLLEKQPDKAKERLKMANASLERVRQIVEKLLNSARESQELGMTPLALGPLAQHTVAGLAPLLESSRVQVVCDFPSLPPVLGDEESLQQVLTNLILNARDAVLERPAESRSLRLATAEKDGRICLSVGDNGMGIPKDAASHIFEPFYTTKPVGKGTGLGLFVCRDIVAQHKGSLKMDTVPGEGTVFTVEIPMI
jgi:signal transduction histidine kinase